jgi:hypothetical protein
MRDLERLLVEFVQNAGASDTAISECEKQLGRPLPKDYLGFMMISNGGEGFVGANSYLRLWKIEELLAMNDGYETAIHLPDCLLFGTDGGDEAFAFDLRTSQTRIVQLPFLDMYWESAWLLSDSFNGFLLRLYEA